MSKARMEAVFAAEKCGETGYAPVAGRGLIAVVGSGVTRSWGIDRPVRRGPKRPLTDASMPARVHSWTRSPAALMADHGLERGRGRVAVARRVHDGLGEGSANESADESANEEVK